MTNKKENIKDIINHYIENSKLKRNDLSNGRWYEDEEGNYYISVTSFDGVDKGKNFHDWLMKNGATYGFKPFGDLYDLKLDEKESWHWEWRPN